MSNIEPPVSLIEQFLDDKRLDGVFPDRAIILDKNIFGRTDDKCGR